LIKFAPQYNKLHNNDSFLWKQSKTVFAVQTQKKSQLKTFQNSIGFFADTILEKSVLTDFVDSMPLWLPMEYYNEITQNMGFLEFKLKNSKVAADFYWFWSNVTKIRNYIKIYLLNIEPEAILEIDDIDAYNKQEGLALSLEVEYLDNLATKQKTYGKFLLSHKPILNTVVIKIFNGTFVVDGEEKNFLFKLIKKTSEQILEILFQLIKTT
jgi:phosphoribosylformylglycinamidine synthase